MASAAASPWESCSLEKHLKCSICMDLLTDAVTTPCGHSFCKECLELTFKCNDRACPLCKTHLSKIPNVNIILRDLAEEQKMKKLCSAQQASDDEVACDVCTEITLKAEKSCLVCLASYCSVHLKKHLSTGRLKGHRLVEPVKNLDERACLQHGWPLELYSRKQQRCVCVRCLEEGPQEVVSTEEEWDKKKGKLDNTKLVFQEKVANRRTQVDGIDASLKNCKAQLDDEWREVEAVFSAITAIVEETLARVLQPLQDRRLVVEKQAADLNTKLTVEIARLVEAMSELRDLANLEDHILFLQSYPSLPDLDGDIGDSADVEFDTSLTFGTMRKTTATMMKQIEEELEKLTSIELKRISKFTVDVKLDPATAHSRLVLSDDGKEVRDGGESKEADDVPERFDLFGSILALNGLTSGRSYWEVEVSNKTGWDLGVARADAKRKGKLSLSPDNGYWVTVHYDEDKYAALAAPPAPLHLEEKPEKVGVFVDHEEGVVSFYNVTARSHIYSFTECDFSGRSSRISVPKQNKLRKMQIHWLFLLSVTKGNRRPTQAARPTPDTQQEVELLKPTQTTTTLQVMQRGEACDAPGSTGSILGLNSWPTEE